MRRLPSFVLVAATLTLAPSAEAATATSSIGAARRTLALGASVVPGVLLHGAGHYAAGDTDTALFLLGIEALGLVGIVGGLAGIALTGASPKTVAPFSGITIAGVGLFASSFLVDVYGVAVRDLGVRDAPLRSWPYETEIGLAYVSDRTFEYGAFGTWSLTLRSRDWRFEPSAWVALDDDNARVRGEVAYRAFGDVSNYADLVTALTHHHYGTHDFAITTIEAAVESRLQLSTLQPSFAGAFLEGGIGLALESHRHFDRAIQTTSLLLGGFGFGFNFGSAEAAVYYDHRHDGFAAGLKVAGLGSGVGGHFGARASWFFSDFGLTALAESGSANVYGLALAYRGGQ